MRFTSKRSGGTSFGKVSLGLNDKSAKISILKIRRQTQRSREQMTDDLEINRGSQLEPPYEAQTMLATFTETFALLNSSQTYAILPRFLFSLTSYLGNDNAHLRCQNMV